MKERFFESQYLGKDLLLGKILRVTQRALTQNPIRCMDNSALFLKHRYYRFFRWFAWKKVRTHQDEGGRSKEKVFCHVKRISSSVQSHSYI